MITKRDKAVLDFIEKFRVASTSTLEVLFYPSPRVAQRRLSVLVDHGELNRDRDHFTYEYLYYIKKPRQLRHALLLTDLYREMVKVGIEIVNFDNEVTLEDIRADGLVAYRLNEKNFIAFAEIQISNTPLDIDKYLKFLRSDKYKNYFPVFPLIIAVTNKKVSQTRDIKIIVVKEDFSNISDLL